MDKKTFFIILVVIMILAPLASAAYATYRHRAIQVADGKDIDLNGQGIGEGTAKNLTCSSNCTGFSNSSANGSYSVYVYNSSGMYYALNSLGSIIQSGTDAYTVLNFSYNTTGARYFYLKNGTNIEFPAANNNIWANATIQGENWNVLSVYNPTVNYLGLQQGSTLLHVSVQDAFSEDPAAPAGTARKVQYANNMRSSTAVAIANWMNQALLLYGGEAGADNPIFGISNYGSGDAIYIAELDTSGAITGSGLRIDWSGNNPAIKLQQPNSATSAPALKINLENTTANGSYHVIEFNYDSIAIPSFTIDQKGQSKQYISGAGFTLRSPSGSYYCVTVDNTGTLLTAGGTCT